MSFDYRRSLGSLRDARKKRGKIELTKKFFDALTITNREMPFYVPPTQLLHPYASIEDDTYAAMLLLTYGQRELIDDEGLRAKRATGNGNCLFNAVSLALIGRAGKRITFS